MHRDWELAFLLKINLITIIRLIINQLSLPNRIVSRRLRRFNTRQKRAEITLILMENNYYLLIFLRNWDNLGLLCRRQWYNVLSMVSTNKYFFVKFQCISNFTEISLLYLSRLPSIRNRSYSCNCEGIIIILLCWFSLYA